MASNNQSQLETNSLLGETAQVDQIVIMRKQGTKIKTAPVTGFGSTKITWRDGKIAQIEHSETEK